MANNTGNSSLSMRTTTRARSVMFYDKLPAKIRKLVQNCPVNISSESLYRAWMKDRRNGITLDRFVTRMNATIAYRLKQDTIRLYGENYPI